MSKLKTTLAAALAAAIAIKASAATPASPQYKELLASPPEIQKVVSTDFGNEAAQCAAYFNLFVTYGKRDYPDLDYSGLNAAMEQAIRLGLLVIPKENMLAMIELSNKTMLDDMHGDLANAVIVENKYDSTCKTLTEQPATRIAYWLAIEKAAAAARGK